MALHALARPDLEALLRARKLDRTLTAADAPGRDLLATGIASLDAALGGGLPRGQMSEIVGPRSSGRTTLMTACLAAATSRGELAALVDTLDMFDPESAAGSGVSLERLLWVRGEPVSAGPGGMPGRGGSGHDRVLDRALKAVNLVLQAGGFDLVVFDLAEVPHDAIRRLPFTTWLRLQRVLEGSRTCGLIVGPAPIARSAGGAAVQLERTPGRGASSLRRVEAASAGGGPQGASRWAGDASPLGLFLGFDLEARVVRARTADAETCRLRAIAG
jgi:recombination protein RecA